MLFFGCLTPIEKGLHRVSINSLHPYSNWHVLTTLTQNLLPQKFNTGSIVIFISYIKADFSKPNFGNVGAERQINIHVIVVTWAGFA